MKRVIIMRGPSGSGKSTFISKYFQLAPVFSADDFFLEYVEVPEPKFVYKFDTSKMAEAHSNCFNKYLHSLLMNTFETLVVDNTNTRLWEFQNYQLTARMFGWRIEVISTMNPLQLSAEELCARNTHGVPVEVIQKMLDQYEPYRNEIHVDQWVRRNFK